MLQYQPARPGILDGKLWSLFFYNTISNYSVYGIELLPGAYQVCGWCIQAAGRYIRLHRGLIIIICRSTARSTTTIFCTIVQAMHGHLRYPLQVVS